MSSTAAAATTASVSLNKDVVKADVTVLRESLKTLEGEGEVVADAGGRNDKDVVKDSDAFAAAAVVVVVTDVLEVVAVNNNVDVVAVAVADDDEDDEASLAAFVKILCIAGDVINVEGNFVDSAKVAAAA